MFLYFLLYLNISFSSSTDLSSRVVLRKLGAGDCQVTKELEEVHEISLDHWLSFRCLALLCEVKKSQNIDFAQLLEIERLAFTSHELRSISPAWLQDVGLCLADFYSEVGNKKEELRVLALVQGLSLGWKIDAVRRRRQRLGENQ